CAGAAVGTGVSAPSPVGTVTAAAFRLRFLVAAEAGAGEVGAASRSAATRARFLAGARFLVGVEAAAAGSVTGRSGAGAASSIGSAPFLAARLRAGRGAGDADLAASAGAAFFV